MVTGKITMGLETDHIVETGTKIIIEEEETTTIDMVTEITGPVIGITVGLEIETTTEMVVGTIIDQIIEGMTVTNSMVTEIRTTVDPVIEIEIGGIGVALEEVPNPEAIVDSKTEMRVGDRVGIIPEIGTGLNQDLDPLLMSVLIEIDIGAIDAMSMIILQENVPMTEQVEIQKMPKALFKEC